jgi:hypothetical protein
VVAEVITFSSLVAGLGAETGDKRGKPDRQGRRRRFERKT